MDKQLKQLKNQYKSDVPTRFTDHDKQAVWQKIKQKEQHIPDKKKSFFPVRLVATSVAFIAIICISVLIFKGPLIQNNALKQDKSDQKNMETIDTRIDMDQDQDAAPAAPFANDGSNIERVTPTENDQTINWEYDNMDRGNHEYDTTVHGKLVINDGVSSVERDDVIYFETPEFEPQPEDMDVSDQQISRIVGLPGETIEIKNGQIYIDEKPLDSFYAEARVRGMREDDYFSTMNETASNEAFFKAYFKMDMSPIEIDEDSVFVLGDQWWRSVDSKYFGPLSIDRIIGQVKGYEE